MDSIANIIDYRLTVTERSFSKFKLKNTYLRSTISQSKLTNLATLSIETEMAENIDFDNLIKEFADRKAN